MQSFPGRDGRRGVRVRVAHAPTPASVAARLRAVLPSYGRALTPAQEAALAEPDPWSKDS